MTYSSTPLSKSQSSGSSRARFGDAGSSSSRARFFLRAAAGFFAFTLRFFKLPWTSTASLRFRGASSALSRGASAPFKAAFFARLSSSRRASSSRAAASRASTSDAGGSATSA